jgi:hypothetical protein
MSRRAFALSALLAITWHPTVLAQAPSAQAESARVVAFTPPSPEPEFGEVFELDLRVRVAPDVVAFLADTMAEAANSVSAGPGSWTVEPGPADSLDVHATYPIMGLLPGAVELPLVELWTRPAGPDEAPGVRAAREEDASTLAGSDFEHALLYLGGVFIMPPSAMVGEDAAPMPRPPADVLGGERSPWLIGALALTALAVAAVVRLLLAGRTSTPAPTLQSPRAEALRELDRIRDLGWHTNGRVAEFYDATTGVLRQYAERREPRECGTALTSTELLARLRKRWGSESIEPLGPTVWTAECVKFGGRRPGAETAEADWSNVRDWIASEAEDR